MKGFNAHSVGRRKSSVARVFLKNGTGKITVNGQDIKEYFPREILQYVVTQPLTVTDRTTEYDVVINVRGGGKSGQAGACRMGLARAMNTVDPEIRSELKPHGFFTRDPREVERKKFGRHKARRRPQFSKR